MNYYRHWIGDFQRDTGHLSLSEQGAYRRMLDHFYATESGLPAEHASICRLVGAFTDEERLAVKSVCDQFWKIKGGKLVNKRAILELDRMQSERDAARKNGRKGGRPKKQKETQQEPSTNPEKTQPDTQREPSRVPSTNPDRKLSNNQYPIGKATAPAQELDIPLKVVSTSRGQG